MDNTLKEIDAKIQNFANKSQVISEYQGDQFEQFVSEDHKYPLLWSTPTRMRIVNGQISFVMHINLMDVILEKSELLKVLSDLAITLSELFTWMDDDSENFMYYTVTSSDFEPFSGGVDGVCGWSGDLTFNLKFESEQQAIRFK